MSSLTATRRSTIDLESATAADHDAIVAIMASRPGALHEGWQAPANSIWTVARDGDGVVAFLAGRIDRENGYIIADQFEGIWEGGKPSARGMRGMSALEKMLHGLADRDGLATYSIVHEDNARHLTALRKRGYLDLPVSMLVRRACLS